MPIVVQCDVLPISLEVLQKMWEETRLYRQYADDDVVTLRCVDEDEIAELNHRYRGKGGSTNVLTFSYDGEPRKASPRGEHDIALCLLVVEREAAARGVPVGDYIALVLVHAFLHVTGLDHERSAAAAEATRAAEVAILSSSGFGAESL